MVNMCSNYLADVAENNRDKGPAFKLLTKTMHSKPNDHLYVYKNGRVKRNNDQAANELEQSRRLETDHDDPNLSKQIDGNLLKLVEKITPHEIKTDMEETVDLSSKYLSQCAVNEMEKGPAFDLLIKQLEKHAGEDFTPEHPHLATKFAVAYVLKSAPALSDVERDPSTAPRFENALHKSVDGVTPPTLKSNMNDVISRCADYLSAFTQDRDEVLKLLLDRMKSTPTKDLVTRDKFTLTYGAGAAELEAAPVLVPFMPVKDIAEEIKDKLITDVEPITPQKLKLPMKVLIKDVAGHLSQEVALKSGIAGERYAMNLLAAIKKSLGKKPLYEYKMYGQTYEDAANTLNEAGKLSHDPKTDALRHKIRSEMDTGVPTRVSSNIKAGLHETIDDAAKHLATVGHEKALTHLVDLMKKEGDTPLAVLQGYQQTNDVAGKRIEDTPSLKADKVDQAGYQTVKEKLTNLVDEKSSPEHKKVVPDVVDDSAKFLATSKPETVDDKRALLSDLMKRKEDDYKLTYIEGGEEIKNTLVGETVSQNKVEHGEMYQKVNTAIPNIQLQETLKESAVESAAHLTNVIDNRSPKQSGSGVKEGGVEAERIVTAAEDIKIDAARASGARTQAYSRTSAKASKADIGFTSKDVKPEGKDVDNVAGVGAGSRSLTADESVKKDVGVKSRGVDATTNKSVAGINDVETKRAGIGTKSTGADSAVIKQTGAGFRSTGVDDITGKITSAERKCAAVDGSGAGGRGAGVGGDSAVDNATNKNGGYPVEETDNDAERASAQKILHTRLRAKGTEVFYQQRKTILSHVQASDWLSKPTKVDKAVKDAADSGRLAKKFERKLSTLVSKATPPNMQDVMQDVIIESSRKLSEGFVSQNYKALVREALISEMQKRGNEIMIEVDGAAETFFFAAQRLKTAPNIEVKEPCSHIAYYLTKKLEDIIRCRSMARKLTATMKEHVKEVADYLSAVVTKPDEKIEAYVALLGEMEAAGDSLLIEKNIVKSYKDSAAYLRQLMSFQDEINKRSADLQSTTESKLRGIMANVTASGYSASAMSSVIVESTRLLVSYVMLQGEKTEALKILIKEMEKAGDSVLLRHGSIRKSYNEAANLLQGKNTDQLNVQSMDPVVIRKIQIKLKNLMQNCTPDTYKSLMNDVIEDVTMYLAVYLIQPQIIQVCKCMKNVFVQCELWCDEMLRRVARPCCTCSRHVSTQLLNELASSRHLQLSPGSSRAYAPGYEISFTKCPATISTSGTQQVAQRCPTEEPTSECQQPTTSYLLYSTAYDCQSYRGKSPLRLPPQTPSDSLQTPIGFTSPLSRSEPFSPKPSQPTVSDDGRMGGSDSSLSFHTPQSTNSSSETKSHPFWQTATMMYSAVQRQDTLDDQEQTHSRASPKPVNKSNVQRAQDFSVVPNTVKPLVNTNLGKAAFSCRAPIVTTDQMSDWHAMMVSLMWNMQAWREWLQENIDKALAYQPRPNNSCDHWVTFQRRVTTEAMQWLQYNNFSKQLTLRLALRYRDKQIISPTRSTVKTAMYQECQKEMIKIIEMFSRWTHWLIVVIKETDSLKTVSESEIALQQERWKYFKNKIEANSEDWKKYNMHLKVCWEDKYKHIISEWLPSWQRCGPVWVVSACGAVPSGAVAAGVYGGEVIWVARTTHKFCWGKISGVMGRRGGATGLGRQTGRGAKCQGHPCASSAWAVERLETRCKVLPAALHPSKHCCLVYADGDVHHYTKYQVMCNAQVTWVAWRAGAVGARAVRVAAGVHVGRVHYRGDHLLGAVHAPHHRCHVVIFGRQFAFSCYELLVLAQRDCDF